MWKFISLFLLLIVFNHNIYALDDPLDRAGILAKKIVDDKQNLDLLERELDRLQKEVDLKNKDIKTIADTEEIIKKVELKLQKIKFLVESINIDIKIAEHEVVDIQNNITNFEKNLSNKIAEKTSTDSDINEEIKGLQTKINNSKQTLSLGKERLNILKQNYDAAKKMQKISGDWLNELQDKLVQQKNEVKKTKEITEEKKLQKVLDEWQEKSTSLKSKLLGLGVGGLLPDGRRLELENQLLESDINVNYYTTSIALLRLQSKVSMLPHDKNVLANDAKTQSNLRDRVTSLLRETRGIQVIIKNYVDLLNLRKTTIKEYYDLKIASKINYDRLNVLIDKFLGFFQKELVELQSISEFLNTALLKSKITFTSGIFQRFTLPSSFADWFTVLQEIKDLPFSLWYNIEAFFGELENNFVKGPLLNKYLFFIFELLWIGLWLLLYHFFRNLASYYNSVAKINFSLRSVYIISQLIVKNTLFLALFFNFLLLIWFYQISYVLYLSIIYSGIIYAVFAVLLQVSKFLLLENIGDISGKDVRLYYGLRNSLIIGFIFTLLLVLSYQLSISPIAAQVIDRLFMLFLLIISYPLLRGWDVLPNLIEEKTKPRAYVKRTLRLVAFIFPLTVLTNAVIGLSGFINLAWQIWIIEGKILLVAALWAVVSGLFSDLMKLISRLFIQQVTNGWLWNESVLKPVTKLLNFSLFILAIIFCFAFLGGFAHHSFVELYGFYIERILFYVNETPITAKKILASIIMLLIVIWATKWSREFAYRWAYPNTKDLGARNSLSVFTQYLVASIGVFVIFVEVLGIPLNNIGLALAGFSVGLGLALREIIKHIVGGFVLLIERPIRAGDRVSIDKYEGEVTKIGLRSITLRTWDFMEVIIPNSDLIDKPLTNWTYQDYIIRTVITIRVSYTEDPEFVQNLIVETLKKSEYVLSDPTPEVFLSEFSEYSIIFNIRYYIDLRRNFSRPKVRSFVLLEITSALKEHDIAFPYPKQEIILHNDSDKDLM